MSVALNVEAVTAPRIVQTRRVEAALPGGLERGHPVERDWLELLAELFAQPPTALPCERIARLLCSTFRSSACSYSRIVDDTVVDGMIWSLGEEVSAPRRVDTVRGPDVASDAVGTIALRAWNELGPPVACPDRLSLPVPLSPAITMAFVLGRDGRYRSVELHLAATLSSLLTALDPRIKAAAAPEHCRPPELTSLTPRELAVLELLGDGLTAVAIAHRLRISTRTVHKHLQRIYGKLDVTDRLAAVFLARRLGLVAG